MMLTLNRGMIMDEIGGLMFVLKGVSWALIAVDLLTHGELQLVQ